MSLAKNQQYLLKILYDHFIMYELDKKKNLPAMDFKTICSKMNCKKEELHFITAVPFERKELLYYNVRNVEGLMIQPSGIAAHSSNKYKKEKAAEIISRIKEYLGIAVSIIAIITAIISIIISITSLYDNQKAIKALQRRMDSIEHIKMSAR